MHMHSPLLALLLLCAGIVTARAGDTKEDFETFISSLPRDILTEQISVQTSLFELLSSYREHKENLFPYEHFHPNEHYGDYGEYHALEAQVNVGVVFIGFPDNSIPRIRDLFFNDLERRDHLHIGEEQGGHVHVTPSPGSAMINHQFHVVDTSFHADEVLRRYMRYLLRLQHPPAATGPTGSTPGTGFSRSKYYLNVWELEEALESLNWHMQHHLNEDNKLKKKRPSLTMYVLNLDLDLDLGVNIDLDLNINPELDVDAKKFQSSSRNTHSYSYLNGFSFQDLDQIRRNATCFQLAKKLFEEKNENFDMTRKVFEHDSAPHVASLHRDFNSIDDFEASITPPPEPVSTEYETWNQHYSDYEEKDTEPEVDEHFRLNEVHSSKAWARGWSDDFLQKPENMVLEARVLRILRTTDPLSTFHKYKYDLARDLVLGVSPDLDTGGEEDNPGISWVGSGGVAWLDLGAKAQTLASSDADKEQEEEEKGLDSLLSLGETLNFREMSRVNSEEREGREDGFVYGSGKESGALEFPHKAELYALRHSLHQHHVHCGRVLLHTRRRELQQGLTMTTSDETLTHEDILYRLHVLPDLQASGAIAPTYKRDASKAHFNTKSFMNRFNDMRSSINDGIESNHLSKFSAILYLQQALISTSLELSVRLELTEDEIVSIDASETDDMKEYYFELMEFHNQVLAEIIELSNMFIGKGHFSRKGFSSKAIHDALACVGSSVLELTRLLLSKPVTVMPHIPQLRQHLATQALLRRNIEMAVRSEKDSTATAATAADPITTNAYALLKELKEDALATAVFQGMQREHQEVLLAQAHFSQARASRGPEYGGYDDDFGRYEGGYYGGGYGRGHRGMDMYHAGSSGEGGAQGNAEVMLTTTARTPPLLVPKYLEIEVYVVKMQDSYYPLVERERKGDLFVNSIKVDARASFFDDENGLGHSLGFDMSTFMAEVQRLKLPNQQMSITVHTINGADEPTLYLGLAGCRRYRTDVVSSAQSQYGSAGSNHTVSFYYSADCVWRHLQHADSVEHAEAAASQRDDSSDTADLPETQHVAMFLLSVDSLSPHYLDSQEDDELHQAVTFGDSILLMQNKQVSIPCTHATSVQPPPASSTASASDISLASPRASVRKRVQTNWKGRNPLRAALEAMSRVILGVGPLHQHTSVSKHSHAKTHLTPLRVSAAHYSDLELAAAFRNRILRSVDFGEALEDQTSRDINSVGHSYIPDSYVYLNSFTSKAIQELDNLNWEKAAVLSNMIVKIAWRKRRHFDAYVHRQKILNNDKKSFAFLDIADPYERGLGGYMDDDYHSMYGSYRNGGDEEGGDTEDEVLAAKSVVWICILLAFKMLFVACVAGGLSYAFFSTFLNAIKKVFYNKSQLL